MAARERNVSACVKESWKARRLADDTDRFVNFFSFVAKPELYAQASFYQGKTITLIVGSGAGTAYDMYGRLLANHIGKHIPGNPNVMVQNMPAAGGMVAANFVYEVAKPDGLTMASINPAHYFNQLQGSKEVEFAWTK